MRIILQRVLHSSVSVDGKLISKIEKGLMVLVGISSEDEEEDAKWCCNRICNARLWRNDQEKPWRASVKQNKFEILLVSQFTLYGKFKGTKPDFHGAMKANDSKTFFDKFVGMVRKEMGEIEESEEESCVKTGVFGAYMKVEIENDGPVTLICDSKNRKF